MKKSNKLTAAVTASVVASTLVAPAAFASATDFTDISNSYAKDAINELVAAGILNGTGNGQFNPTGKITRQDFAIILAKALQLDTTDAPATPTFSDVPASHYSYNYVEAAVKAELIAGVGNGEFGLGQNLTREAMAVLFVRALGVDATGYGDKLTFADASKISGWAKDAVGYAVEAGLMNGAGNNSFNPQGLAERQQVALVASNFLKAQKPTPETSITTATYVDDTTLTVSFSGEVADLKAEDVTVAVKGTGAAVNVTGVTVAEDKKSATVKVEKLIGGTTFEVAYKGSKAELKSPDKLEVVAAKQVGANKIQVEFSQPAEGLTFGLKRGSINVVVDENVEWNANKTVATISTLDKLTTAQYALTVTGKDFEAKKEVAVAAAQIANIEIAGDILPVSNATAINYTVKNQFGEEMTVASSALKFYASAGVLTDANGTDAAMALNLTGVAVDTPVVVTVVDEKTGVNAYKSFKVGAAPVVSSFTMKEVKLPKDVTRVGENTSTTRIAFEALDQYGNKITTAAALAGVQLVDSSANVSTAIIDEDGAAVIQVTVDNNVTFDQNVILTSVLPNGNTSKVEFKVYDSAAPATVAVGALTSVIAAGDQDVSAPLTIQDQFGNTLTAAEIATAVAANKFNIYATNPNVVVNPHIVDGKLVFNAGNTTGTSAINVMINGTGQIATLNVTVEEARHINRIELKNAPAGKLLQGATTTVQYKLFDQYGKEWPVATDNTGYKVNLSLTKVAGDDNGVVVGTLGDVAESAIVGGTVNVTADTAKTGEYKLTAKVLNDAGDSTLSQVSSNFKVVDGKNETLTYNVADIPTLYKGNDAAYATTVTVEAKDAAGVKVAIPTSTISDIFADSNIVTIDKNAGTILGNNVAATADAKTTVTVVLTTPQGTQIVKKDVTVSAAALSPEKIAFSKDDVTITDVTVTAAELAAGINVVDAAGIGVVVTDQFGGTSLSTPANVNVYAANTGLTLGAGEALQYAGPTVSIAEGTAPGVQATGKFTVTAVTKTGKAVVLNVTIAN